MRACRWEGLEAWLSRTLALRLSASSFTMRWSFVSLFLGTLPLPPVVPLPLPARFSLLPLCNFTFPVSAIAPAA